VKKKKTEEIKSELLLASEKLDHASYNKRGRRLRARVGKRLNHDHKPREEREHVLAAMQIDKGQNSRHRLTRGRKKKTETGERKVISVFHKTGVDALGVERERDQTQRTPDNNEELSAWKTLHASSGDCGVMECGLHEKQKAPTQG